MVQIAYTNINYVPTLVCEPYFQWFSSKNGGKLKNKFFSPNIINGASI